MTAFGQRLVSRFDTCQGLIGPGGYTAKMPYISMASSVLVKAIADWRRYGGEPKLPRNPDYRYWLDRKGFRSSRQELKRFFTSKWCEFLLGAVTDLPYDDFLKALGVT